MRLFWNGFFVAIVLMVSFALPARAFDLSQVDKTVRESLLSLATSAVEYADILNAILNTSTTTQNNSDSIVRITVRPAGDDDDFVGNNDIQDKPIENSVVQANNPVIEQVKYITREYYNTYLIQDPELKDKLLYLQNKLSILQTEIDKLKKRPVQVVNNYSSPAPVWNAISLTNKIDKLYGVKIDASPIGVSKPSEGHFTNLTANTLSVENFVVDTVTSENADANYITASTTETGVLNVTGTSTLNLALVNNLIVNDSLHLLGTFLDANDSPGNNGQVLISTGTSTLWADPSSLTLGSIDQHSDVNTSSTTPILGQVLKWDGNAWVPGDDVNIYEKDGTLTSNRNIELSGYSLSVDGNKLFIGGTSTPKLGIGTNNPNSPLVISNDGTVFEFDTSNFSEPEFRMTTSDGKRASFAFRYQGAGEAVVRFTKYADPVKNWAIGIQDNDNAFRIKQGFAGSGRLANYLNEYFIILPDGRVGVGTSTPTHRLSVEGDVNINGLINVNGNPLSLNDLQDVKTDYANSSMYIGDGYPAAATGANNLTLGPSAGASLTSGFDNIALGEWALKSETIGARNLAIGRWTLMSANTTYRNTAIGNGAMFQTQTGGENTSIGESALSATKYAQQNIAIGTRAGTATVVSGAFTNATSTRSIYIGVDSQAYDSNTDNEIVIGYGAKGLGSNTVVLGNDNIVTTALKGKVGIGTTTPDRQLDVFDDGTGTVQVIRMRAPNATYAQYSLGATDSEKIDVVWDNSIKQGRLNTFNTAHTLAFNNGVLFVSAKNSSAKQGIGINTGVLPDLVGPLDVRSSSGSYIISALDNGNVGFGTSNPLAKVHIENGELWTFSDNNNPRIILGDNTTTGQYGWLQWDSINDYFRIDTSNSPALGLKLKDNTLAIGNVFPDPNQLFIAADNTNTHFVITKGGNVGVGTTTPDQKLHVDGGRLKIVNSGDLTWAGANSGLELGHFTGNYGYIQTYNSTPLRINPLGNSVLLVPNGIGAVGIGTASPTARLNVNGGVLSITNSGTSVRGGGVGIEMGSLNTFGYIQTYQSRPLQINPLGNNILLNPNTGRVGIGTTVPTEKLHVKGKILAEGETDAGAIMIKRTNATAGANFIGFIQFADYLNNIGPEIAALDTTPSDSAANADLRFYTDNRTPRLTIQGGTGNVGVGTIDPQTKFHVVSAAGEGNVVFERNEDSVNGAAVTYRRSRGDKINKTALQSGDVIGGFNAYGHDGTTYVRAASIRAFVDGTVSAGVVPGRIVFETADTAGTVAERLRISNNGNVGINTNAPTQKLDVAGNVRIQGALFDSLNSQGVQGQVLTVGATGNIEWKNPVSCVLGGASVQGNGTVNSSYGIVASVTRTNTGRYTISFSTALTVGQYYAHLTKVEDPAVREDVNIDVSNYGTNDLQVIIHDGDNGSNPNVYVDRDFSVTLFDANCTALSPIASSDRRLKTNIENLNSKVALDKILRLQGVRFNWNIEKYPFRLGFDEKPEIGFVAQDVLEIVPEVVDKAPDGYYTLDYEKLTALTVEAIKELWQEITGIKAKVKEIEMLKRELCEKDSSYSWCPKGVNTSSRRTNNNSVANHPKVEADTNTNTNMKPINGSNHSPNASSEDDVKDDSQDTQSAIVETTDEITNPDAQVDSEEVNSEEVNNEVDNNDQGNVDNVSDNTYELTDDSINNEAGENIDAVEEDENVNVDSNLSEGSGEANIEEMNEDIELTDNNTEGSETSETVSNNTANSSDESMDDAGLEESASETPVDVSDSDVSSDNNNDQTSVSELEVGNSDTGA